MDDEDETEVITIPAVRARPIDYVTAVLIFVSCVADEVSDFCNMIVSITARHANYKKQQQEFADTVRADLEKYPDEGGVR